MRYFRVENASSGTLVASRVSSPETSRERRHGLLGQTELKDSEGCWILPCEAIHTIGMRFPIDVVFLDLARKVIRIHSSLQPWRISACWRAHSVLELGAGQAERVQLERGHLLQLSPLP